MQPCQKLIHVRREQFSKVERKERESNFLGADSVFPRHMPKRVEQGLKFVQEARASENSGVLHRIS